MSELWADPIYRHHNPPLRCRLGLHTRGFWGHCMVCGDRHYEAEQKRKEHEQSKQRQGE